MAKYEIRETSKADPTDVEVFNDGEAFEIVDMNDLQSVLTLVQFLHTQCTMAGDFDTAIQVWDNEAEAYAFNGLTQYLRRDASTDKNAPYEVRDI